MGTAGTAPVRRRRFAAVMLAATATLATATVATTAAASTAPATTVAVTTVAAAVPSVAGQRAPLQALRWQACPIDEVPAAPAALRCAALQVPLDYAHPDGRRITVTISRLPAPDPGQRRGVLLINPGGPGVAGLGTPLLIAGDPAQAAVAAHYDLIGFDPRGTGASTPVDCGLDAAQVLQARLPWPGTGGFDADAALARSTATACTQNTGALLPYLSTANTARDLDAIRSALDQRTISYLGVSYGTYLGAVYASLFPDRVDRFVFDSNADPRGDSYDSVRATAPAVDARFTDLAGWIAARDGSYHLGDDPAAVRATILTLLSRLDRQPQAVAGTVVTSAVLRSALYGAFASAGETFFPDAAPVVRYLVGDHTVPADQVAAVLSGVTTVGPGDSGTASAMLAVTCADGGWPGDPTTYRRDSAAQAREYPVTGGGLANIRPCAYWPGGSGAHPVPIAGGHRADVLMLQNLRDPVTPYDGAARMRQALGDSARMVSVDAAGHGVGDNPCALDAATAWLLDGVIPAKDTSCPA